MFETNERRLNVAENKHRRRLQKEWNHSPLGKEEQKQIAERGRPSLTTKGVKEIYFSRHMIPPLSTEGKAIMRVASLPERIRAAYGLIGIAGLSALGLIFTPGALTEVGKVCMGLTGIVLGGVGWWGFSGLSKILREQKEEAVARTREEEARRDQWWGNLFYGRPGPLPGSSLNHHE